MLGIIRQHCQEISSALGVYFGLAVIASDSKSETFTTTHAWLASLTGFSEKTVRRRLLDLEQCGAVEVTTPPLRAPCTYRLLSIGHHDRTFGHTEAVTVTDITKNQELRTSSPTPPLPHLVPDVATATPIRGETELPLALPPNGTKRKSDAEDQDFAAFWSLYPRKIAKQAALKAWRSTAKLRPPMPELMEKLQAAVECSQWRRDNGQFIPHPATWLNQRRWEDDVQNAQPTTNDTETF